MSCPFCGTVPVPGAKFCHNCGSALPAAAASPTTERRVVTVLFGDLSDFTAWAEDLDPERVGAVTDRVLAALARAVTMFGGHVDKLTGDGIMAVFGAPVAHEDDPERAVRAALAMQRAVRRVLDAEQGGGVPLGLRVGLNTGVVVAGVQASLEYTVIGDTVNTAARLADAAGVGTVYAGARTVAATRHLAAWRQMPPLRLKGKRAPVGAFELLGLRDAPGTRSGLGDEAPFVGRETEMGLFSGRLAEVVDRRHTRVLMITAEAGIGKTRFAMEAGRYAKEHGARVLYVRCAAYGENRRLAPLADLVRAAAGLSTEEGEGRGEDATTVAARLIGIATRLDKQRQRTDLGATIQVPLLLSLAGYSEYVDRRGERRAPDPDAVPAAVAELLNGLATESPLVVTVDDMHDATNEAIDALADMLALLTGPILMLLLGRPELVRKAGMLTRLSEAEAHTLAPLRGADAARLLSAYLSGGQLPAADEHKLLSTAQGNPFYLAELVTLLVERGMLTGGPDGWRLAPGSLDGRLLTRDLAAVLTARIDALPPDARALLRDAAVAGDTVPAGALEAMQGGSNAVAAVARERALEELLARRMLRKRGVGGYAFVTPLMRQAAYSGVGRAVLAERHALLARWGAEQYDKARRRVEAGLEADGHLTEEQADEFTARHAERAIEIADGIGLRTDTDPLEVSALGVAALTRMARRALAAGTPAEAASFLERAMRLAGGELPTSEQLVYARALLRLGRADQARAAAETVAAKESGQDRVTALLLLGQAHRAVGERQQAVSAWQEALRIAERPADKSEAMYRLGIVDYFSGRLAKAQERFQRAYEIAAEGGDPSGQAWSLLYLAWVTATRADFTTSDAALAHAARLFAQHNDVEGRAWTRGVTAFTRLMAGRFRDARRLATGFLALADQVRDDWAAGILHSVAGFAAAELGDLDDADDHARSAYQKFDAFGDDWGRGLALVVRGIIERSRGESARATRVLDRALEFAERAQHAFLIGVTLTVRGLTRLDVGDGAQAEADARRTLKLVESLADARDAVRVAPVVLLGQARAAQGDVAGAAEVLREVVDRDVSDSLIFPARMAMAVYAQVLLAGGDVADAVDAARRALETPSEDVRSGVVAHRAYGEALAQVGELAEAWEAAERAAKLAYATDFAAERQAVDALVARLADQRSEAADD